MGSTDEITNQILNSYDERMIKAVQHAFDIFDVNNRNEILAVELERVLCSLGITVSVNQITDLIYDIDRKNTGMLEFNSFITYIIPFLRAGYKNASVLSLDRLKQKFDMLDINSDGTLNPFEFRFVVNHSNNAFTNLTNEESDQIVEYLDVDKDEMISWDEFKTVCNALSDDGLMEALPEGVRTALRKVRTFKNYRTHAIHSLTHFLVLCF